MPVLNWGILSTASVNDYSFLPPVKQLSRVKLIAVASRGIEKAAAYAKKHRIRKAYGDYSELLNDPEIHCVYIPLPNSMHAEWAIKALEAGKHVLCEKPVAANEEEARAIAKKVKETGLTFAEAFHYRYHPLAQRLEEIVRSGDIGEVLKIRSQFCVPLPDKEKVQFKSELAGGALLDIGCYPVSFSRWIAGCDDAEVVEKKSEMLKSGVDGATSAVLKFANGVEARIRGGLTGFEPMFAFIQGSHGSIFINMPFNPAPGIGPVALPLYMMIVQRGVSLKSIRVPARTTYYCQLAAFCKAVREGRQPTTDANEAVANMRLLDAIARKS